MERRELAAMIDHTALKPETSEQDVARLCMEAKEYGFASVCINPYHVARASQLLSGSGVEVCTVVGFPLGATTAEIKAFETRRAVSYGADEVDMVMNIGALKDGADDVVREDIAAVVEAADGKIVKVIIEACLLTREEKVRACQLAKEAGAHFVKTSTGFAGGGATVEDVRLMRETVGPKMGVKAAGGIRSAQDALAMVEAGANRIGTSSGVQIVSTL